MPCAQLSPAARGALVGLILGLLLGGVALLALGAIRVMRGFDCAGLTPEECALDREIAVSFARRQVWVGGALALMGIAVFMWTRGRLAGAQPESHPHE